jgi:pyridoxamine 5'-phosphate oxidase
MSDWKPSDLSAARVSYDRGELNESDLLSTPLAQFEAWLQEAKDSGLPEPNAMVLTTVDGDGVPTSRTVLLKGVDASGFRFFTNTRSRKAKAMAANSRVSLLFPWHAVHRQVAVLGMAEPMSVSESEAYFQTRPRDSQLSAWASMQSEPVADRAALEARMAEIRERFPEGAEVPMPKTWGGCRVRPDSIEFWHGRESRLHDRLRFEVKPSGGAMDDPAAWQVRRYSP